VNKYKPKYSILFGNGFTDSQNHHMSKYFLDTNYNYNNISFPINDIMNININNLININLGGFRGPLDCEIFKIFNNNNHINWIYDSGILSNLFYKKDYSLLSNLKNKIVGINVCNVSSTNAIYKKYEKNSDYHNRIGNIIINMCN